MDAAINEFFAERKTKWINGKVKTTTTEEEKSLIEDECQKRFPLDTWLPDAAKRAGQLKMVTHPSKFSHPSSKTSSVIAKAEKKK